MGIHPISQLRPLVAKFWAFAPYRILASLGLMLLGSFTSGVGILMIIPLMGSVGIDLGVNAASPGIAASIDGLARSLGLTLELESVLALYVVLVVVMGGVAYLNTTLSASLRHSFVVELRSDISRQLFYTQWRYLNQRHMSDFMRLLTGQVQGASHSVYLILQMLSSLVLLFVYLAFSVFLSLELSFIALVCGLLLAALLWPINKRIHSSGKVELGASRDIHRSMFENLSSLKIIKSFAAEEKYLERLNKANRDLELQQIRINRINALTRFINVAGASIIFAILFYSAIQWLQIPVANLIVILFIFSRLMPQISGIQATFQNLVHRAPAYQDLVERSNELGQWQESTGGDKELAELHTEIALKDVAYEYLESDQVVLKDFNIVIPANETVAIVGPSGIGKSTLADIIAGLIAPTRGYISIDQQKIDGDLRSAWRRQVAYVTQDVFLFHDTVRENLLWVCEDSQFNTREERDAEIWRVLKLAAADEFIANLPEGLDTLIGDRGVKLSGGERQRLALARALLSRPKLLILDEATSALDRSNELKIRDALLNLNGKLTIVVIAHNDTTIEHVSMKIELGQNKSSNKAVNS